MKKVMCMLVMLVGFIGTLSAQAPIEQTKKVTRDEVPVTVLKAYEANFGSLANASGFWKLVYTQYNKDVTGRLVKQEVFTPIAYVYRDKATKAEARFDVNGKLENAKGLTSQASHGEK